MNSINRRFLKNIKNSIKDSWEYLNELENKDSDTVADLYRYFMQMAFKHIPLEERPNNQYWKLAFQELMNAKYDIKAGVIDAFEQTYKPYALFKLIRDNAMPQKYKKIVYDKHRKYYIDGIKLGDLEFTRIMMHFAPYLSYQDKYTIGLELMECKKPRKYITDFVNNNNVLDEEILTKVNGFLVMRKLCQNN